MSKKTPVGGLFSSKKKYSPKSALAGWSRRIRTTKWRVSASGQKWSFSGSPRLTYQRQRPNTLMRHPLDLDRAEGAALRFTATRGSSSPLLPLTGLGS